MSPIVPDENELEDHREATCSLGAMWPMWFVFEQGQVTEEEEK